MAELDSNPKSVQSLYVWYTEGKLSVNRRYQRKLVWTLEEKQRLVESVLKKYPIPAVLLAERSDGGYEIIDGLQRLHTLMSFIETSFDTLDGRRFKVSEFPTANNRFTSGNLKTVSTSSDISSQEVSNFLDYTVAVSVMRGATEAEIDDVFGRINTYGHQLSDQERRQAGVQDQFSETVRALSCTLRGDETNDILDLSRMPAISIDLPKTNHGYEVKAEDVFWVDHGILRTTDLRDSMDEQCLADILACIVGGQLIPRSKDALDAIYDASTTENLRLVNALSVYGADIASDEILYCIDEIRKAAATGAGDRLKDLLFSKKTNNAFSALFTIIVIAFHEVLIGGRKRISNYGDVKTALTRLDTRIDTSRGSTKSSERRKNIDVVKGLLGSQVVDDDLKSVYSNHSIAEIDATLRRSEIELPSYELKQGLLSLDDSRGISESVLSKVPQTLCAIANISPTSGGQLIIGVADKNSDIDRIKSLDGVYPRVVGTRAVVGVQREASRLGESIEDYYTRWKNAIRNSGLSSPLLEDVLSHMSYHDYFGLGLIIISVRPQSLVSYVGRDIFVRSGDDTRMAADAMSIASVLERFK